MNSKKKKFYLVLKILYCIYIVLFICFIFRNSALSVEKSSAESKGVLEKVNTVLEKAELPPVSHNTLRKSAHVVEFFILGLSVFGLTGLFGTPSANKCFYCAVFCLFIAMTDETIQYFSQRGSMVLDVWLDAVSSFVAITLMFIFYSIMKISKNKT